MLCLRCRWQVIDGGYVDEQNEWSFDNATVHLLLPVGHKMSHDLMAFSFPLQFVPPTKLQDAHDCDVCISVDLTLS